MRYQISAVITYGAMRVVEAENQTAADRIAGESKPEDFNVEDEGIVTRTVVTVVPPVPMEEDEEEPST